MLNSVGFSRRGRARVLQMPFLHFLIASDFYKQYFKEKCIFLVVVWLGGEVGLHCTVISSAPSILIFCIFCV